MMMSRFRRVCHRCFAARGTSYQLIPGSSPRVPPPLWVAQQASTVSSIIILRSIIFSLTKAIVLCRRFVDCYLLYDHIATIPRAQQQQQVAKDLRAKDLRAKEDRTRTIFAMEGLMEPAVKRVQELPTLDLSACAMTA